MTSLYPPAVAEAAKKLAVLPEFRTVAEYHLDLLGQDVLNSTKEELQSAHDEYTSFRNFLEVVMALIK